MARDSAYKVTKQYELSAQKICKAIPVSLEQLAYIEQIAQGEPKINTFYALASLFAGSFVTCLIQAAYGSFQITQDNSMPVNRIVLFCLAGALLLLAVMSYLFARLRQNDEKEKQGNLGSFIQLLRSEFEIDPQE